ASKARSSSTSRWRPSCQAIASSSLYTSESENSHPGRSVRVSPRATRSKFSSQPSRSIHSRQCSRVAAEFVFWGRTQKPTVSSITSFSEIPWRGDRVGSTGAFARVHCEQQAGAVWSTGMRSVLHCTGGHAGGDVALGGDEQERRGDGGDHGGRHDRVPLGGVVADVVV